MKCKDCKWFIKKKVHCSRCGSSSFHDGMCRKNPPQKNSESVNGWPSVSVDDWCGGFEQKE